MPAPDARQDSQQHEKDDLRQDSTACIGSWLRVLASDKRFIFVAAAHAQRACDFLWNSKLATSKTEALPQPSSRRSGSRRRQARRLTVFNGYATVANFRNKGVPRRRRILLSASLFLFATSAALLSYLLLKGASDAVRMAALAFVAGLLTVATVEDMLEEAHEVREDNRLSVLAFVGGFALFTLVSAGLKSVAGG